MSWFRAYLRSSIGMKQLMGVTGLGLIGFVIIHMLGNLLVFLGQDTFNNYPVKLRSMGALLWVARGGLLGMFALHVIAGISLAVRNSAARPVAYATYKPRRATFYGRYMALLGVILLAYVVFHLLHFTFGFVLTEYSGRLDGAGRRDLYSYFILSFQHPAICAAYLFANTALCLHLLHGLPSLFQSVGLRHPKYNVLIDRTSLAIVTLIFAGNCSMPLAVLFNIIPGGAA